MKVVHKEGAAERQVLIGMITSNKVLGKIASKWTQEGLFGSKYANRLGWWCVQYYNRYGKAPNNDIENIYKTWAEDGRGTEKEQEAIERLLASLSANYEQLQHDINPDLVLDTASNLFNKVRQQELIDLVQGDIDLGNVDAATEKLSKWSKVEINAKDGLDLMNEKEAWLAAFEAEQEPIVVYPGDLGKFFGSSLQRDAFIAFTGPEKRGKSFILMDLAWRAMCQRRKVAFFEVGDMSESQILLRWGCRAAKKPLQPAIIQVPISITKEKDIKTAVVAFKEKTFKTALTANEAFDACQQVMEAKVKSSECYCKLSTHSNSSINIRGIRAILDGWAVNGWFPDVIIIDYADILAPPANGMTEREQINTTWKEMRRLSQDYHVLLVTATQSDASSYEAEIIRKKHFSDDKRKHAHVTGMVGINQTEEEREIGVYRYNWVDRRSSKYSERFCVHVAGCLDISNPNMISTF